MTILPSLRFALGALVVSTLAAVAATAALAQAPGAAPAAPAAAPAAPPSEFGDCQGCHSTAAGAGPSLGPNLYGVGGRKAGSGPDFDYSDAMKASTLVWTSETLQAFILDPGKTVPGTKMDYAGASDAATAKTIADYLMTLK